MHIHKCCQIAIHVAKRCVQLATYTYFTASQMIHGFELLFAGSYVQSLYWGKTLAHDVRFLDYLAAIFSDWITVLTTFNCTQQNQQWHTMEKVNASKQEMKRCCM